MGQVIMLNTDDLTRVITNLGLPVSFSGYKIGPVFITYEFNLLNARNFPKIKKTMACLSSIVHKPVKVVPSETSSFAISIEREERLFPRFSCYHDALEGKEPGEILFGLDQVGNPVTKNIRDTKSLLIAGSSGGGKSVLLSNILCSLFCYSKPEECGVLLIDLKRVEFELFKDSCHLVMPVQFEYSGACRALDLVKNEIDKRYSAMQKQGIRKATVDKFPLLVVVIDEYAMLVNNDTGHYIDKVVSYIASTGRACNVFIIVATQHAVSSVISNTIKSNLQSRIGLRTTNTAQSTCILGTRDCVDLLGYGDSYAMFDGVAGLQRIQTCYLSDEDIYEIEYGGRENQQTQQVEEIQKPTKKKSIFKRINEFLTKLGVKNKTHTDSSSDPFSSVEKLNYLNCVVDDDSED